MNRIIEGAINSSIDSPERIRTAFQGVLNKSVLGQNGISHIDIMHNKLQYVVTVAHGGHELEQAISFDTSIIGHQRVTIPQLESVQNCGAVLLLKDQNTEPLSVLQVILSPSPEYPYAKPDEAFCAGLAVRPGVEREGYLQIMLKAQEVLARVAGKNKIGIDVEITNIQDIRTLLNMGFRIVARADHPNDSSTNDDNSIRMEKDLKAEPLPFNPRSQSERIKSQISPVIFNSEQFGIAVNNKSPEIGISISQQESSSTSKLLMQRALDAGYVGMGILLPLEFNNTNLAGIYVFQRKDCPPFAEKLKLPIHVSNETCRLREVIMSNSPDAISMTHNLNAVAQANAQNLDAIAFKEEHAELVSTLEKAGVRVVRTSAFPRKTSDGKTALFTRDPAFVLNDELIIGKLNKEGRRYESDGIRKAGGEHGIIDLADNKENAFIEGGDIINLGNNVVIVGIGQRTNEKGFEQLAQLFPNYEFIGVKHNDLHLDVLFTVLSSNKVLADITKLPEEFIKWIENMGYLVIPGDQDEQISLGCNVLTLDENTVVAVTENTITNERLRHNGVNVIEVSMPNVIKKGGGPRCLTCPTNRD